MSSGTTERISGTTLLPEAEFARIWRQIVKDNPDLGADMARRQLDQALAYLGTAAAVRGKGLRLSPSKAVDGAWHTLPVNTLVYLPLVGRLTDGGFVHHVPTETDDPDVLTPSETAAVIAAAGFRVDAELWPAARSAADCNQCYAGCSDSPNTGGKK